LWADDDVYSCRRELFRDRDHGGTSPRQHTSAQLRVHARERACSKLVTRRAYFGAVLLIASVLVAGYLYGRGSTGQRTFGTARIERGPITATVSTTGTLNAVITVQVGTQISGQVSELFVDFNSRVTKGQVVARINAAGFEAKVNQARADVEAAEANVLNQEAQVERAQADVATAEANVVNQQAQVDRARADVDNARSALAAARAQTRKARIALGDATRDLDRKTDLFRHELISRAERDTAQALHDSAIAQFQTNQAQEEALVSAVRSAQGQLASSQAQAQAMAAGIRAAAAQLRVARALLRAAEATVRQKRAALEQARVDLGHTLIRSPVDGIVVSRSVDVGQTVAASLQAPTLFTIAQDLTKMQVDANVDEADIGRIREGQKATFTVDSFRSQSFTGTVAQVRKAARVVQNVVTYNVVIAVDNADQKLLPGLTANVRIAIASRPSALKVPNVALRFRPTMDEEVGAPASERGLSGGSVANVQDVRDQLVRTLKLDQAQEQTVSAILEARRQQSMGVERLPGPQRRTAALGVREEARVKIRALLSPEQQLQFDQLPIGQLAILGADQRSGTVWVIDRLGRPTAVTLILGVTDGSYTEILESDLSDGREVIVSDSPVPREEPRAGGGVRLRL
jgi:HlyD family secretion protein